jgi:imidazolonepropionase-like amidohydrolase
MKTRFFFALLVAQWSLAAFAQTYITNVTIVDVIQHALIANQTIVVTNGRITNIQASDNIVVPENSTKIDGRGKFVLPGLVDAHVHFFQSGGLYTRPDVIDLREVVPYQQQIESTHDKMEETLRRYLQNGITTVFDVGATHNILHDKERFATKSDAPSIYMTGPLLTTYFPSVYENLNDDAPFSMVTTPAAGIKMVQAQLPHGPDFIKIWYITTHDELGVEASAKKSLPIVKAIINEAHRNHLKVAVHATQRITAQLAVENGCDFLVHGIDDEIVKDDFIQLLKNNNTLLSPTLVVHNGYRDVFGQNAIMDRHDLLNADPYALGTLQDLNHLPDTQLVNRYKIRVSSNESKAHSSKADSIRQINLKRMADAGVLIVTGTDAGNIGTLHASSYWHELNAMQKSGMSNWQILQASTLNGAKIVDMEKEWGSVSIGKKANLLILDANPIENLENITKIYRLMNKGVIFNPETLIQRTPTALVQQQLNAYNYRNIDAFLEPFADDVEVYAHPDQLLYKGKENMRVGYANLFERTPNLHCELKNRIVQGQVVIDQERVRMGEQLIEAVAIYHIENNKIKKVSFIKE